MTWFFRLTALVALTLCLPLQAAEINRIIVFGDSLSDTGKMYHKMKGYLPSSPPYFEGRFSNGPVWTDLISSNLEKNIPLINEAEGGATAVDYRALSSHPQYKVINHLGFEIDQFEKHNHFTDSDLVVIWMGANDYLAYRWNSEKDAEQVMSSLFTQIARLSVQGVNHIMLVNLPDLGTSPQAVEAGIVREESHIAQYHNRRLSEVVATLYNPEKVKVFDIASQFNDIMLSPQDYGLQDVTTPCYDGGYWWKPFSSYSAVPENAEQIKRDAINNNPLLAQASVDTAANFASSFSPVTCQGHLFWDKVHPTFDVHRIIAARMAGFINQQYLQQ